MTAWRHRRPRQLGLGWAVCAAVALHGVGALLLSGPAWSGRGDSAVGGGALLTQTRGSLRVRLAVEQSVASVDPVELESAPMKASGGTPLGTDDRGSLLAATYLPAELVDRPPEPDPGWIIDEAAFTEVGRGTMVLRLWVSESGRIDRVRVVQAEPPGEWLTQAIRPLPETRMRPAERGGHAVASTVVVELAADFDSPPDETAAHAR
jgi:hypothetical protein